uniref:Uncharacterized protein n=1 Tax=Lactuca sativa TaxID=4236 RepID=A0A9R1V933_LACSA|nr:hypothetical protein LSAT_V11C600310250 [Lactuca sativa]
MSKRPPPKHNVHSGCYGREQPHPTYSIGLGVANNLDSCTWFLMRLKEALKEGREVSFITNMDDVISSSICQELTNVFTPYAKMVLLGFDTK